MKRAILAAILFSSSLHPPMADASSVGEKFLRRSACVSSQIFSALRNPVGWIRARPGHKLSRSEISELGIARHIDKSGDDVYLLGSGVTGQVYRVLEKETGRSWILKLGNRAGSDFAQLQYLRSLEIPDTFRIIRAKPMAFAKPNDLKGVIRADYVPGTTLYSMMTNRSVSAPKKEQLKLAYETKLRALQNELNRQGHVATIEKPSPVYFQSQNKGKKVEDVPLDGLMILHVQLNSKSWSDIIKDPKIQVPLADAGMGTVMTNLKVMGDRLIIKSDNVIVDPATHQMTLVDPY